MPKRVKKTAAQDSSREMVAAYEEFLNEVSMIESQAEDRLRRLFANSDKKQIEKIKKSLKN